MFKLKGWIRRHTAGFVIGFVKQYPTDFSVAFEPSRILKSLTVQMTVRGKVTTLLTFDGYIRRARLAMQRGEF